MFLQDSENGWEDIGVGEYFEYVECLIEVDVVVV